MTTLYWRSGDVSETHPDIDSGRVYIETETGEDILPPAEIASFNGLDALRGGPPDERGKYVPVTPEHSAALRKEAEEWGADVPQS